MLHASHSTALPPRGAPATHVGGDHTVRKRTEQTLTSVHRPGRQMCRLFREQVTHAMELLALPEPRPEDIHDARKLMKRSRAALRFARLALGDETYHRENAAVRSAAHELNATRDAEVLLRAFELLIHDDSGQRAALDPLHKSLERARTRAREHEPEHRARAHETLEQTLLHTRDWNATDEWYALAQGLEQTYRKSRRAYRAASKDRTDAALHAWRRQAKYLRHQLEMICVLAPHAIGERARRFAKLSDALGDDHDLALLQEKARKMRTLPGAARTELAASVTKHRASLQKRAFRLGETLYADKPGRFIGRVDDHWRRWAAKPQHWRH